MRWVKVINGEQVGSLTELGKYEDVIEEGQRTRLDLRLSSDVLSSTVTDIRESLRARGVPATVWASGKLISIVTRKGAPWLLLIMAALAGLILLAILLVAWQLWKEVADVVPAPLLIMGITVIIIIALIVTSYLVQRRLGV